VFTVFAILAGIAWGATCTGSKGRAYYDRRGECHHEHHRQEFATVHLNLRGEDGCIIGSPERGAQAKSICPLVSVSTGQYAVVCLQVNESEVRTQFQ
jgi:hypothetical protein